MCMCVCVCVCVCVCSVMSGSFVAPWTAADQAPLSMECSRQKYWSGLSFPPPKGIFLTQGSNPHLLHLSPALAGGFFTSPRDPDHTFCIYLLHCQEDSLPAEPLGKPSRDDWLTPNFNPWLFSQKESQSWKVTSKLEITFPSLLATWVAIWLQSL